jgi:hypothetical protein
MSTVTSPSDLTITVTFSKELRLRLEQLRLTRAHNATKIPTLRALIEEAVLDLVEKEPAVPQK